MYGGNPIEIISNAYSTTHTSRAVVGNFHRQTYGMNADHCFHVSLGNDMLCRERKQKMWTHISLSYTTAGEQNADKQSVHI